MSMVYVGFISYITTLVLNALALFIIGVLAKQYNIKALKYLFNFLIITFLSTITYIINLSVHSVFSINLDKTGFNTLCLAIILPVQYLLLYWFIINSLLMTEEGIDEFTIPVYIKRIFYYTPLPVSIFILLSGQFGGPWETITAVFMVHLFITIILMDYQFYLVMRYYKKIEPSKKKYLPASIISGTLFTKIVIIQFYFPLFWDFFRDIINSLPKGIDFSVINIFFISLVVIKNSTKYLFIAHKHEHSPECYNENIKRYTISKREEEIISLIVEGYSNRAISAELEIALTTVKKHINNMFQKTDVENRIELINLFRYSR